MKEAKPIAEEDLENGEEDESPDDAVSMEEEEDKTERISLEELEEEQRIAGGPVREEKIGRSLQQMLNDAENERMGVIGKIKALGIDLDRLKTFKRTGTGRIIDDKERDEYFEAVLLAIEKIPVRLDAICACFDVVIPSVHYWCVNHGRKMPNSRVGRDYQYTLRYTPSEREKILEYVNIRRKEGLSLADACRELGLPTGTYTSWTFGQRTVAGTEKERRVQVRRRFRFGEEEGKDAPVRLQTIHISPAPQATVEPTIQLRSGGKFAVILGDDGSFDKVMSSVKEFFSTNK